MISHIRTTVLCFFVFLGLSDGLVFGKIGMPLHASCKITWTFNKDCTFVNKAITVKMNEWKSDENCKQGGEKCLYVIEDVTASEIKGKHLTPVKKYSDSLSFKFQQDGATCSVEGYSSSDIWYAVLDYGTNYCNLHNLITASGLDKVDGYSEDTSNASCTQYSSANCGKY